ncbi:nuclear transport factor 2 family protein [Bradyrhizobium sp. 195]|uniref:nuclear transport factor 2 family protein n=1 Tax=Bradyrhizobium sp. 195 TaxID=2782662 RepID=UPI002001963C|nr:nuclear transport factor 2 family protein [Bradyrhizobium sp. 195]UPK31079.1 nuclear transport factor 2 family protein [Bradyrhizobium sp. 195]
MSGSKTDFDPIGIVIDRLDACRERRLEDLLALYADRATLDCCDGNRFIGRSGLLRYWPGKLRAATGAAFLLDEVVPEKDYVRLDYRDYDGSEVGTKFWFDDQGNITRTLCVPRRDGARSKAAQVSGYHAKS